MISQTAKIAEAFLRRDMMIGELNSKQNKIYKIHGKYLLVFLGANVCRESEKKNLPWLQKYAKYNILHRRKIINQAVLAASLIIRM